MRISLRNVSSCRRTSCNISLVLVAMASAAQLRCSAPLLVVLTCLTFCFYTQHIMSKPQMCKSLLCNFTCSANEIDGYAHVCGRGKTNACVRVCVRVCVCVCVLQNLQSKYFQEGLSSDNKFSTLSHSFSEHVIRNFTMLKQPFSDHI